MVAGRTTHSNHPSVNARLQMAFDHSIDGRFEQKPLPGAWPEGLTLISRCMLFSMTLGSGRFISFTASSSPVSRSMYSHVSPVPPLPRDLTARYDASSPGSGTGSFGLVGCVGVASLVVGVLEGGGGLGGASSGVPQQFPMMKIRDARRPSLPPRRHKNVTLKT